jgi:hypothetical protein|tara:strand:+ start:133 stop:450 length:318 start_codon:yes stop_codon:yes gene_type:complete
MRERSNGAAPAVRRARDEATSRSTRFIDFQTSLIRDKTLARSLARAMSEPTETKTADPLNWKNEENVKRFVRPSRWLSLDIAGYPVRDTFLSIEFRSRVLREARA